MTVRDLLGTLLQDENTATIAVCDGENEIFDGVPYPDGLGDIKLKDMDGEDYHGDDSFLSYNVMGWEPLFQEGTILIYCEEEP